MLATDFHIVDRKISMGYWKRKSHYKKTFLRDQKMLATDFHIMDRKISMG